MKESRVAVATNKYKSVVSGLKRPLPDWVTEDTDAVRVAAYDGYSDMYRNVPETFKLVARGEEDQPIYIPSARKIIEATNRYLAKSWDWTVRSLSAEAAASQSASDASGTPQAGTLNAAEGNRIAIQVALANLFKREEVPTKFYSIKRNMLLKGDALWHLMADMGQVEGQRIAIKELDPRNYFRIPDPNDFERTKGCYIVDLLAVGSATIARRLEYRRVETDVDAQEWGVPVGTVYTRLSFWETKGWDDRWDGHPELKPVPTPEPYASSADFAELLAGTTLPPGVTSLPVYHIRNNREGNEPFGGSQIAGIETMIMAINQGASDEDITLALQGLGIYVTSSKPPVNDQGEETEWFIAPASVLEMNGPNDKFARVDGLKTMLPFQEHLTYLDKSIKEATGLSAVAVGQVDVSVASSGVALRLEMAPILSGNEEKEVELLSRMDQMLYDIVFQWLPLDGVNADPADILVSNSFGDPLPPDEDKIIDRVTKLVTAGLVSKEWAVKYLSDQLGYQFPADMLDSIAAEADAVASRMTNELVGAGTDGGLVA
jgi:hypothetical protein